MKKLLFFILIGGLITIYYSCSKEQSIGGPNVLGGETDIPLTVLGSVSDLYIYLGGSQVHGTMTITAKQGGICTYHALIDFTGHPDSAFYASVIPRKYFDSLGRFNYDIKMNITSEGIQEYSYDGSINNPWTIVKYNDGVGTVYPFRPGSPNIRTVTAKSTEDDFPMGFYLIKVSKVVQPYPPDDQYIDTLVFYANHKFGLVTLEVKLKSGILAKCDVRPWFLL